MSDNNKIWSSRRAYIAAYQNDWQQTAVGRLFWLRYPGPTHLPSLSAPASIRVQAGECLCMLHIAAI